MPECIIGKTKGGAMPTTYTPLRYPGGKTKIYPLVKSLITDNGLTGCTYGEAFAGGCGLAMKLLLKGEVSRVVINDIDRAVFCMWKAIVGEGEDLCNFIDSVELTVDEWREMREIYRNKECIADLELGKAAFYLNRTNRSGILEGGVIGGYSQSGTYKMDARFTREALKDKVKAISARREDIDIYNLDAEDFIENIVPGYSRLFLYLDPPYVKKGPGLYRNSFDTEKHRRLAEKIRCCESPWMVTYDDDILISEIYDGFVHDDLEIGYSAYKASVGKEKLILGPGVNLSTS